jgi:hypothetical protein
MDDSLENTTAKKAAPYDMGIDSARAPFVIPLCVLKGLDLLMVNSRVLCV